MNDAITKMPIGPNANGEWVNFNHECECGYRLPLPKWADKFCPNCGTQQPGSKQRAAAELEARKRMKVCPSCNHENDPQAKFCTECGAGLKEKGDAITKVECL